MQVHFILPSAPMEDLMKLKWSRIRWKIRRKYLVRDSILVLGFTKRVNYRKAEKKMRSAPNKSQYRTLKNKSRPTLLQSAVLRRTPNIHRTFQLHYKFFVVEKLIQIIHWKFSRGIIVKTPFWALTLFTCTIPLFKHSNYIHIHETYSLEHWIQWRHYNFFTVVIVVVVFWMN